VTDIVQSFHPSPVNHIRFSVAAHAAWAPGRETAAAWQAWADAATDEVNETTSEPGVADATAAAGDPPLKAMPAMLRRRASPAGKMALEAAYAAYPVDGVLAESEIPAIFCSRHGECGRSAELLIDLARGVPLSPAAFSLSVHNATAGLFSIARRDHANSLALAAGRGTVEHAAIEACGLLADGAPAVLLVAADGPLPPMYQEFADCDEQAFGWAWLLTRPDDGDAGAISLRWSSAAQADGDQQEDVALSAAEPGGLQVMRFFLSGAARLERQADRRHWTWSRDEG
jgi:hypothetical protein